MPRNQRQRVDDERTKNDVRSGSAFPFHVDRETFRLAESDLNSRSDDFVEFEI